jgi:hypothetical protein
MMMMMVMMMMMTPLVCFCLRSNHAQRTHITTHKAHEGYNAPPLQAFTPIGGDDCLSEGSPWDGL